MDSSFHLSGTVTISHTLSRVIKENDFWYAVTGSSAALAEINVSSFNLSSRKHTSNPRCSNWVQLPETCEHTCKTEWIINQASIDSRCPHIHPSPRASPKGTTGFHELDGNQPFLLYDIFVPAMQTIAWFFVFFSSTLWNLAEALIKCSVSIKHCIGK